MTNDETRELAIKVLQADSQERVIALLKAARLWDAPDAWRFYGDRDGNYSTIGNQHASPESALVEKIVNAVDARLMNECLKRGIDPASDAVAKSIREAVRQLIEGKATGADIGGTVQTSDGERQREEAKHIAMAMTGYSPKDRQHTGSLLGLARIDRLHDGVRAARKKNLHMRHVGEGEIAGI